MRQNYSNKTGYKGVAAIKTSSGNIKYRATVYVKGEPIYLGLRDTAQAASELYEQARIDFSLDIFEAVEVGAASAS